MWHPTIQFDDVDLRLEMREIRYGNANASRTPPDAAYWWNQSASGHVGTWAEGSPVKVADRWAEQDAAYLVLSVAGRAGLGGVTCRVLRVLDCPVGRFVAVKSVDG